MSLVPYNLVALAEDDSIGGGKNIVAGASVNITKSSGGSAQIYNDEAGTSLIALPTNCDPYGELKFFISPGDYFYTVNGKTYKVKIEGEYPYVIHNVSELPSITAVAGRIYELKEYNAGTGVGGGPLVGVVGAITPNNVTTFAGTAGTYFKRLNYDYISPQMGGCAGENVDNLPKLNSIAAICSAELKELRQPLDEFLGVSGNFVLPDNLTIVGLKLKQLTPSTATRTIFKNSGSGNIKLKDVVVNRNGKADATDTQVYVDAAGVWLQNFSNLEVDGLEVYGDGQGTGARFISITGKRKFKNINAHDITWWSATTPTTEKAAGFGFQNMSSFIVDGFNVSNILSKTGADPTRRFQADGVDFGGCSRFIIKNGYVQNTGEGIDITGSDGNDFWKILNVYAEDCGFTSFKVANGVRYGQIAHCTSVRGGWQGISIVGVASAMENSPGNIQVHNNQVYDTGANPEISGGSTEYSGIAIDNRDVIPATPFNVQIYDNIVIDRQPVKTMNYGIYQYESQYIGQNILLRDNIIEGFTVKDVASRGSGSFNQSLGRYMYASIGTTGTFSHPTSGSWLLFVPNSVVYDESDLHLGGTFTIKTKGLYELRSNIVWATNATGVRGVRIKVNGTVIGSMISTAVSGESSVVSVTRKTILNANDLVTYEFLQSSGAALNVSNTGTFAEVTRLQY